MAHTSCAQPCMRRVSSISNTLEPVIFTNTRVQIGRRAGDPEAGFLRKSNGERVLRELSGHPAWASARNKDPKPKELVCDGGKVGAMPKYSMLVAPLWEEYVNVKACLGINTQSNQMKRRWGKRRTKAGPKLGDRCMWR